MQIDVRADYRDILPPNRVRRWVDLRINLQEYPASDIILAARIPRGIQTDQRVYPSHLVPVYWGKGSFWMPEAEDSHPLEDVHLSGGGALVHQFGLSALAQVQAWAGLRAVFGGRTFRQTPRPVWTPFPKVIRDVSREVGAPAWRWRPATQVGIGIGPSACQDSGYPPEWRESLTAALDLCQVLRPDLLRGDPFWGDSDPQALNRFETVETYWPLKTWHGLKPRSSDTREEDQIRPLGRYGTAEISAWSRLRNSNINLAPEAYREWIGGFQKGIKAGTSPAPCVIEPERFEL